MISKILTRAQSLKVIHLCGNPGLGSLDDDNSEMIEYIRKRIKAKYSKNSAHIPHFDEKKRKQTVLKKNIKAGIANLFGGQQVKQDHEKQKWIEIREGLKLKSIINSKRINEVGPFMAGMTEKKLII